MGTSLAAPWLRLHNSSAGGVGSIPGQGAEIPHASGPKNQNVKWKQDCHPLNKDLKNGPHTYTQNFFFYQKDGMSTEVAQEIIFIFIYFLFLAVLGLCCCTQAFSSCSKPGLLSRCSLPASHCRGFSCWGAWARGAPASVVAAMGGLVAPQHMGSSWTRDRTCISCLCGWILFIIII